MTSKSGAGNRAARALIVILAASLCLSAQRQPRPTRQRPGPPANVRLALGAISAASLRGHLSFIASDLLEGRNTPSQGLDIAAEYIAAQFRRAGLEPIGDDGYFQTARWVVSERDMDRFQMEINAGNETIGVDRKQVSLAFDRELKLARAPLVKVDYKDVASLTPQQVEGKVVLTEVPDFRREDRSRRAELLRAQNDFLSRMADFKAAAIISIDRHSATGSGASPGRLIDPENSVTINPTPGVPMIRVHNPRLVTAYDSMSLGATAATVSTDMPAPSERPVKLRNVIGLLRGSDPALKDTYVLVTAHYDHLGARPGADGDRIFNGANDDGSGTVSVIELAAALATLKTRPKRSIAFMTFFGEEKGLLGSRYYGRHPVLPLEKTIADVNLEQVGRTDSTEGPQLSNATLTGFDYSDIGEIFKAAGQKTGVVVYKHERNSDAFFSRSDNQALADQGVPAHTLSVAFAYPDYHTVADHWDKIDYANMEKVNRMVALALFTIADSPQEPKWNEANPKAARYVQAWRDRRGK